MKIAIIGAGNVGGTLGKRFAQAKHQVIFGSRDPKADDIKKLLSEAGGNASAATIQEAVAASDLLLVALPWDAAETVVRGLGDLQGKVLIDVMNPVAPDLSGLVTPPGTSAGEMVQTWAPSARVVKAFNTIGFNVMQNPDFGRPALLFYCGNDAEAKKTVHQLATDIAFNAQDAGPLSQARVTEQFALLWISLAVKFGYGRDFAFDLLTR